MHNSAEHIVSSQPESVSAVMNAMPALNPSARSADAEFELLRACCQADSESITAILRTHLRWERVFELASYHRLLPVLCDTLQGNVEVPGSIRLALRSRFARHCQRVLRLSAELTRILRQVAADSIPVIALKGPVLAQFLHGDPAMREFSDLDLMVHPSDVARASAALRRAGYDNQLPLTGWKARAYLRSGYEYVFGRGEERNLVELQWNVAPRFYSIDVDIGNLFDRSLPYDFADCNVRVLSREDQMLYLCVHAAKHQWSHLGMIRDIAALARRELDWEWVADEATRLGIARTVRLSLLLSYRLMGVRIPDRFQCASDMKTLHLASLIESNMRTGRELSTESVAYFRLMLQLRERWRDRACFLWRLATTPSVGEWQTRQIPDVLHLLYSGVRAVRLGRRLAASLVSGQ